MNPLIPLVKRTLLGLVVALLLPLRLAASEAELDGVKWSTDYAAAMARAQAEQRPLLLKFTGSDWCPPCKRLAAEVFDTPEMAAYAEAELVAVYIDFPRTKPLPAEVRAQNDRLAEQYGVTAYPTVKVVAPDGQVLGQLGYMEGGPKTYIRAIKRLLRNAAR